MTDQEKPDLISEYLALVSDTEAPVLAHRWSCIAGIGALLGRSVWFDAGIDVYYPNMYVMLVGTPGSRKSTAIKMFRRILSKAGYNNFAAERTSKEKFLMDMAAGIGVEGQTDGSEFLSENLFSGLNGIENMDTSDERKVFIVADEFNNFFGNNIVDFVSLLGDFWDYKGTYTTRLKNSESIVIPNPCISILTGNTPEQIHATFPPAVIGQGFFSRLMFIYTHETGKSIPFPTKLSDDLIDPFVKKLQSLSQVCQGEIGLSDEARELLSRIYHRRDKEVVPDPRFSYYSTRRFTQLQKLSMIHAIADYSPVIELKHVRRAYTVMRYTEHSMPRALGSLGRAKNSEVMYKLLELLEKTMRPMELLELWPYFLNDLGSARELGELVNNLVLGGKVNQVEKGIIIKRAVWEESASSDYDWDYLSNEERGL